MRGPMMNCATAHAATMTAAAQRARRREVHRGRPSICSTTTTAPTAMPRVEHDRQRSADHRAGQRSRRAATANSAGATAKLKNAAAPSHSARTTSWTSGDVHALGHERYRLTMRAAPVRNGFVARSLPDRRARTVAGMHDDVVVELADARERRFHRAGSASGRSVRPIEPGEQQIAAEHDVAVRERRHAPARGPARASRRTRASRRRATSPSASSWSGGSRLLERKAVRRPPAQRRARTAAGRPGAGTRAPATRAARRRCRRCGRGARASARSRRASRPIARTIASSAIRLVARIDRTRRDSSPRR